MDVPTRAMFLISIVGGTSNFLDELLLPRLRINATQERKEYSSAHMKSSAR